MVWGYSYVRMGMVWCGGMCVWCVIIVDVIGIGGCWRKGSEVYNWLVGKLMMLPWVCRNSISNTTGKRIFLLRTSCTWNVLSLIAMDSKVIPSAIRGLPSAPETEICIGCSGGTKANEQYSCSSKRLIEEHVSIKIAIVLWSKVPDTRHWWSFRAWFLMTLL